MRSPIVWVLFVSLSYRVVNGVPPVGSRKPKNPTSSTTEDDYQGYLAALEVFRLAFDFSTEEQVIYPKINPSLTFGWDKTSWVMGVRGRDIWGKWYWAAECMAVMVLANVAMMPCACMWSWYRSFRSSGIFKAAADRTPYDIATAELFLFHTLHEGEDYFRDEITRYYTVINSPLESLECTNAINPNARPGVPVDPFKRNEQLNSWGLVELETPVYEGASVPVRIPLIYVKDDYTDDRDVRQSWSLTLLAYGTSFADDNILYVPQYALKDYNEKHERWRAWSNNGRLKTEMVAFSVKPKRGGCRPEYDWTSEHRGELECWQADEYQKQICDIQPGAPIVHEGGFLLYGVVMNKMPCPNVGKETFFEVRRFTDVKKDTLKELLVPYEEKLRIHQLAERNRNKAQRLFNQSLGEINYDEDIDPVFRYKIRHNITLNPGPLGLSRGSTNTNSLRLVVVGMPIIWYIYQ